MLNGQSGDAAKAATDVALAGLWGLEGLQGVGLPADYKLYGLPLLASSPQKRDKKNALAQSVLMTESSIQVAVLLRFPQVLSGQHRRRPWGLGL